jgi:uncharacterized membrane protein YeaQ/YmgE (transglycosylase-associated protein family)
MMHWIYTILVGLVVGFIARAITPGRGPTGFIMTAALGIGGSILASFVGQAMGWYKDGQLTGLIGSVVGAVVLCVVYHFVTKPKE